MKAGNYLAIAKDDLDLPDRKDISWKKDCVYNARVDETGTMALSSETETTYYTSDAVERMQDVFRFLSANDINI